MVYTFICRAMASRRQPAFDCGAARAWPWEKTLRLGNTMRFPLFRCHWGHEI